MKTNTMQKAAVQAHGPQDVVALQFARRHADTLRYVAQWDRWMEWDGQRWRGEETLHAFDLARAMLREIGETGAKADAKVVAAVVALARADRLLVATTNQWDRDPWLLGTPDGTVDLRSGELLPANPDDYISKSTAVAPDADCPIPLWQAFLDRVMGKEQQRYLQRVCGYCLTGDTREEALFFSYGTGGNGKGTFWETIAGIMGDYHAAAEMEMFTSSQHDRHSAEMAVLHGARMVTATETEEGRRWNESKIKKLTGGGPIAARYMRRNPFTFIPQFKLSIDGNHKPRIRTVDEAIRRRMNLIPFAVTIPKEKRDRKLKLKLRREWPGILAWMIKGCLMWQREGLKTPENVLKATAEYLASEDTVQQWLNECCDTGPNMRASNVAIWVSFKNWAEAAGEYARSQRELNQKLEERGFEPYKSGRMRGFRGLRVLDEE
jgi:putative DNA primase/helicase